MRSGVRILVGVVALAALGGAGLGTYAYSTRERVPPQATRRTPPPGIAGRALGEAQAAPDFALPGSPARPTRLADALREGPVFLLFFRGHWCPYCRDQLQGLQKGRAALAARGAQVLAVSADSLEDTRALAQRLGLTFPLLADPERAVIRRYGVEDAANEIAWPALFLVTRGVAGEGQIRWREVSDDYRDRPSVVGLLTQLKRLEASARP